MRFRESFGRPFPESLIQQDSILSSTVMMMMMMMMMIRVVGRGDVRPGITKSCEYLLWVCTCTVSRLHSAGAS